MGFYAVYCIGLHMFAYVGKSVDFQGFSGCLGWVFGEGLEGFRGEYWVYNRCILGVFVYVYAVFMGFMQGLCSVCSSLYIHRGNGLQTFSPFPLRGSGGRSAAGGLLVLVRCCCWWGWGLVG